MEYNFELNHKYEPIENACYNNVNILDDIDKSEGDVVITPKYNHYNNKNDIDNYLFFDNIHSSANLNYYLALDLYEFLCKKAHNTCAFHTWESEYIKHIISGSIYTFSDNEKNYFYRFTNEKQRKYWYFPLNENDNYYWEYLGESLKRQLCTREFRKKVNFWDPHFVSSTHGKAANLPKLIKRASKYDIFSIVDTFNSEGTTKYYQYLSDNAL